MTSPVKPGDRVRFDGRWTATVAKVEQNGTHWDIWLRDYSDEQQSDDDLNDQSIWWWDSRGFVVIARAPLDYPRYATLDEIPIEPGRVEWHGHCWVSEYAVYGLTSAFLSRVYVATTSPEHRYGATVGEIIQDFWAALCGESDEDRAWLWERYGRSVTYGRRTSGWYARIAGLCEVEDRATEAAALAALRRAVEAIESGDGAVAKTDRVCDGQRKRGDVSKAQTRYFLDQDNSCHWYLVEADHRGEWNRWNELDEDDPRSWEPPLFASRVGAPNRIVFVEPQDESGET